ncbi:MAG TPA: phosphatase PAP2 family protein [Bdellovibrionota bacterium]|nr:phosphatase PAP2 family protein [Bdellovibrionota bacterium]
MALPLMLGLLVAATHVALVRQRAQDPTSRATRTLHDLEIVFLAALVPVFYSRTGEVISAFGLTHRDDALMGVDRSLLGWLFPDGQISFWLDSSSWWGPQTLLGRVATEFLQLAYFSYYVWGYLLFLILGFRWVQDRSHVSLAELKAFMQAWVGCYLVNFLGYILVPAVGPQFVFASHYTHPLQGFWVTPALRDFIHARQTTVEDCFPSGHTAMSWVTGLYAWKLTPSYGRWALGAAIPVTAATLFLRYHYVADLLAAVPLVGLGLAWGDWIRLPLQRAKVER